MKKFIFGLVLLFSLGGATKLMAQETKTQQVKFYYYPSSNIYYNVTAGEYWYYDDVSATWTQVKTLPESITLTKAPVYTVYYNGEEVWKENAAHMKKYKVKNNGTIKAKKPMKDEPVKN
jgi:hypothetical protein